MNGVCYNVVVIIGVVILLSLVYLAYCVKRAPKGREDEKGFHRED